MTLTLTATIPVRLDQLRTDRDITLTRAGEAIGVTRETIRNWGTGAHSPGVYAATAYAATFGQRIVVTRNGRIIGDLLDALPRLSQIRSAAGLTQVALAKRLHLGDTSVGTFETHARRRPADFRRGPLLSVTQRYFEALGYEVGLAPLEAAVPSC